MESADDFTPPEGSLPSFHSDPETFPIGIRRPTTSKDRSPDGSARRRLIWYEPILSRLQRTTHKVVGARGATGTWNVELVHLQALGLSASNTINIHTLEFPGSSDKYQRVDN